MRLLTGLQRKTSPHTVYESSDDVWRCVLPFLVQGTLEVIHVVDIIPLTQSTTKVDTYVLYRWQIWWSGRPFERVNVVGRHDVTNVKRIMTTWLSCWLTQRLCWRNQSKRATLWRCVGLKIYREALARFTEFSNIRLGVYTPYAHENSNQSLNIHTFKGSCKKWLFAWL